MRLSFGSGAACRSSPQFYRAVEAPNLRGSTFTARYEISQSRTVRRLAFAPSGSWSGGAGLPQPLEPVEDHVERELELEVGVAAPEAVVVRGAKRHLGDVGI